MVDKETRLSKDSHIKEEIWEDSIKRNRKMIMLVDGEIKNEH